MSQRARRGPGGLWRRAACAALVASAFALGGCGANASARRVVIAPAADLEQVDSRAYHAFLASQVEVAARRWVEAADWLEKAIHHDPTAVALHLELARVAVHNEALHKRGLEACDVAETLEGDAADIALARASLYAAADEPNNGIAALEAVRSVHRTTEIYDRMLALTSLDGVATTSLSVAEQYVESYPNEPSAWRALGDALAESEPLRAAEAYMTATRQPDPRPSDAGAAVRLLLDHGTTDAVLEATAECREHFYRYWLCVAWDAVARDRERAEGAQLAPQTREALERLAFMTVLDRRQLATSGAVLREDGSTELADAYVQVVADERPDNIGALDGAAWIAHANGNFELAVEMMHRVLAIDDANFDALNYIGYTWADLGVELERAEVYIREALFLRGEDGNILDSLAWVYFRQGRFEEALETQTRALELVSDSAVMWDHMGDIQDALGDRDAAIRSWERALELATEFDEDVLDTVPEKLERARGAA